MSKTESKKHFFYVETEHEMTEQARSEIFESFTEAVRNSGHIVKSSGFKVNNEPGIAVLVKVEGQ